VRLRAQAGHEAEITGLDEVGAIRIVELRLSGRR
jgi:hypothetical protein